MDEIIEEENFGHDWPKTDNLRVIDRIPVPHPYCITPKHLEYAESRILDDAAIERAEKKGAVCDICRKAHKKNGSPILAWAEHKNALLIEVTGLDFTKEADNEIARQYLLTIVDRCKAEGYAGFCFVKAEESPEPEEVHDDGPTPGELREMAEEAKQPPCDDGLEE
jgi:hypothetical protein